MISYFSGGTATSFSGVLPVANGGTGSSAALTNNRVMQSSGGVIIEAAAITASRALVSDANGIPVHSSTSTTEVGYLAGAAVTNGGVIYGNGSAFRASAAGSSGQILRSAGAAAPTWSTATYPATAGSAGNVLVSDGTNFSATTINLASSAAVGTSILALANGGTAKAITAVNGGVVWTDADSMEVSAAGTAGDILTSNGAAAPTFKTTAANLYVGGTRTTGTSMSAGTSITPTVGKNGVEFVAGNGGAITITASPPVSVTSMVVGQELKIVGTSDSNTVTYNSSTAFVLNGSCTLGKDQILHMMYCSTDGSNAAWVEIARSM